MTKQTKQTKKDLFLELAKPNKYGYSQPISIKLFKDKYSCLIMGNGGDWCRSDGILGKQFILKRNKENNKIVSIELAGFNNKPINKSIRSDIKELINTQKCKVLFISGVETDHKNGRYDSHAIIETDKQNIKDFQALSRSANLAKRQHCKTCKETNIRFKASLLGYSKDYFVGNYQHLGDCTGCYWHDPFNFNKEIST